ncbi:MAG: hypothetical protein AVDCRST_MAG03-2955 [uncultured Rubrobacteraceae bacterium]|uniref:Uncharacterized protein n=1 Tax=uncultured Rubrobacteraceae bacterium TaxID=349277 RepID=A0A6J4PZX3_9ACTN|nr:MAG: hypothetical protein AVDCRST_MAG03-2955 [uncultured Rubrobacteraceae bacterium]
MDPAGNVASGGGRVGFEKWNGRKLAFWLGDPGGVVSLRISTGSERPPKGDGGRETVGVSRRSKTCPGLRLWAG